MSTRSDGNVEVVPETRRNPLTGRVGNDLRIIGPSVRTSHHMRRQELPNLPTFTLPAIVILYTSTNYIEASVILVP
jgi:hypothetical protein